MRSGSLGFRAKNGVLAGYFVTNEVCFFNATPYLNANLGSVCYVLVRVGGDTGAAAGPAYQALLCALPAVPFIFTPAQPSGAIDGRIAEAGNIQA